MKINSWILKMYLEYKDLPEGIILKLPFSDYLKLRWESRK